MARTKAILPTAARRDINTSSPVEEEPSLPDGVLEISLASNVLSSFKKSYDPAVLDAPPIIMSEADQAHVNGVVAFYPTSKIRHCPYFERDWEILPWVPAYGFTDNSKDPFGDFESELLYPQRPPVLHHFPVGKMDKDEIEEYRSDQKKWYKSDHLSLYTDWSEKYDSRYEDSRDVFSFYTASGEMTTMVEWFNESRADFDNSDINVAKICACIWKRIHPPSFILYRQKKIDASPDQNGYDTSSFKRMKGRFEGLPHSFSVMKKRVISIIGGNGSHFVSYMAVNFGSHFREDNCPKSCHTFIARIDSGDGNADMDPFIQWLLAVIYELEVWVTQFLNTSSSSLITSPLLANIGRKCKRQIQSKEHTVCIIPISPVKKAPTQDDSCNCGIFSLLNTRAAFLADVNHHVNWNKVVDGRSLWSHVLKPFWELPRNVKQRAELLEERITKFRSNFNDLLANQASGLISWQELSQNPPLSPSSSMETDGKAETNTISSETDSDADDGKDVNELPETQHADKTFAGIFSTQLKVKAAQSARKSQKNRVQRGRWRQNSATMTYEERQEYFKVKRKEMDEKALISTQPGRDAIIEKKRKDIEWKENSLVIEGIYRKPEKISKKDKNNVNQILDKKFPITDTTGETEDKSVSQISHLKYFPPQSRAFTSTERSARKKAGLGRKGYEMHLSAYYQGLWIDKKGNSHIVDELNHMWVRDVFAEPFVALVKKIGKEETETNVLLNHRKWFPVPLGDSNSREVSPSLVVDVRVHYKQGAAQTCLFRSLASAFHHLGRKDTGSALASMAKKFCSLPAEEQLLAAIKIVKTHERVYKKIDYWRKEAVIAKHDFFGQPNDNPKLFVLRGADGGVHHAISVVRKIVFDSNLSQCLTLSKASFDWCCNCEGGFSKVHAVIQFRK